MRHNTNKKHIMIPAGRFSALGAAGSVLAMIAGELVAERISNALNSAEKRNETKTEDRMRSGKNTINKKGTGDTMNKNRYSNTHSSKVKLPNGTFRASSKNKKEFLSLGRDCLVQFGINALQKCEEKLVDHARAVEHSTYKTEMNACKDTSV